MAALYHDSPEEKERRRLVRKASEDKRRDQIRAHDRARRNTDEARAKRRERNRPKIEARRAQKELEKLNAPPRPPVLFKVCPHCDPPVEKSIHEFNLDKNRADGHYPFCKECVAKKNHARLDKRREYARKKMLEPEHYEKTRKDAREWKREHPLAQKELTMRRNARKKEATTERVNFQAILERDGMYCYICERDILPHQKMEFDHIVPLIPRPGEPKGTHCAENIKVAHAICNRRKASRRFENLTLWDKRGIL